ncbi:MAG: YncE family protein [Bryobacteraceae bacterium]
MQTETGSLRSSSFLSSAHRPGFAISFAVVLLLIVIAPRQTFASSWTKPEHGWLLVLDTNEFGDEGQILLVDPQAGLIRGKISTGVRPDFALSRDGTRLYVTAGNAGMGSLSVYDTSTGTLAQVIELPDHLQYTTVGPSYPLLAVSPDGRRVYIENMRMVSLGVDEYKIATFDTLSGTLLPESAMLPACGPGRFISVGMGGWDFQMHCFFTNSVQSVKVTPSGSNAQTASLSLPENDSAVADPVVAKVMKHVSAVVPISNATLAAIRPDGAVWVTSDEGASFQPTAITAREGRWVPMKSWPISPDNSTLYIGSAPLSQRSRNLADDIAVVDTRTFQLITTIQPGISFFSIALSGDGRHLYAVTPEQRSISVINTSSGRLEQTLSGIGQSPAFVLTLP